jgi:DNA-binding PadR family transcriptional regulator
MDMAKARRIIKVCGLIAQMPSGGGWTKSSEIVLWSSVSHATTYRYLPKLTSEGYLDVSKRSYRNGYVNHYKITPQGLDYLKSFREIL